MRRQLKLKKYSLPKIEDSYVYQIDIGAQIQIVADQCGPRCDDLFGFSFVSILKFISSKPKKPKDAYYCNCFNKPNRYAPREEDYNKSPFTV